MQPYTGTEPATLQVAEAVERAQLGPTERLKELRNLMFIASGWIAVLLILPPQHEYPIIDDWIYAGSVQHLLSTGVFVMPPLSQANLVGLTFWGAGWAQLLGFSFTTLTYSTIFMSFVALFSFYGVARATDTRPWGALLGTALLAYNPLFVHLSYSFMTDVPFIALMLLSCFCYIRGIQGHGRVWFWIGGLMAGWSFLIRQFGALIPVAFLAYLLLDSLLTRKLRIRDLVETVILPAIIVAGWIIWSWGTPPNAASVEVSKFAANFIMKEPWLRVILERSLVLLPIIALSAACAIKIRRSRLWLVAVSSIIMLLVLLNVDLPTEQWIETHLPDYSAQIGPVTINFSNELFTFGDAGNIIRITGIDFFEYPQQAIFTPEVWHALWIAGLVLGVLLLAKCGDAFLDWLRDRRQNEPLSPVTALYLLGAGIFVVSVALLGAVFDRYVLVVLPFVLLFLIRGSGSWGRAAWTYSIVMLAIITTSTLLAKADNIDHDNARWQAGQWMLTRTGAVHVGYDFNNWDSQQSSDTYVVADAPGPPPNFRIEQQFPYFSRLGGFTTRYLYAESSLNVSPVPSPTPSPSPTTP
jgi:4-amino-4-deoxy-L-arabinose transferase-like glycosyltransferase